MLVFACLLITSITTVHICSVSLFQLQLLSILMFALPLQLFVFVLYRYFHNSYFQYLILLITSVTSVNISSISLFSLQPLSKLILVRYFHYKCYFRYNYCQYLFLLITSITLFRFVQYRYFHYSYCQYLFSLFSSVTTVNTYFCPLLPLFQILSLHFDCVSLGYFLCQSTALVWASVGLRNKTGQPARSHKRNKTGQPARSHKRNKTGQPARSHKRNKTGHPARSHKRNKTGHPARSHKRLRFPW